MNSKIWVQHQGSWDCIKIKQERKRSIGMWKHYWITVESISWYGNITWAEISQKYKNQSVHGAQRRKSRLMSVCLFSKTHKRFTTYNCIDCHRKLPIIKCNLWKGQPVIKICQNLPQNTYKNDLTCQPPFSKVSDTQEQKGNDWELAWIISTFDRFHGNKNGWIISWLVLNSGQKITKSISRG